MSELKIGEIGIINGQRVRCVKMTRGCFGCVLIADSWISCIPFPCQAKDREDGQNVNFIKVED